MAEEGNVTNCVGVPGVRLQLLDRTLQNRSDHPVEVAIKSRLPPRVHVRVSHCMDFDGLFRRFL